MLFRRTCSGIFVDAWETGGYCSELPGYVVSGAERGGIVQFILYHFGGMNAALCGNDISCFFLFAISGKVADAETRETGSGYLIGTHPVIFQASAIIDIELGSYLPVVCKVKGEFVLISLCIFGTKFVVPVCLYALTGQSRVQGTCSCGSQQLWIVLYGGHPLQRRGIIIKMVIPFVHSQTQIMVAKGLV